MANDKQNQLWKSIKEFKSTTKPSKLDMKEEKQKIINITMLLLKGRGMAFKEFQGEIVSLLSDH